MLITILAFVFAVVLLLVLLYWVVGLVLAAFEAVTGKTVVIEEVDVKKPDVNTDAIDQHFGSSVTDKSGPRKVSRIKLKKGGDSFDAYSYVTSWLS
ncbi:MAG: hypothetical protein E7070_05205 [Bacteroidales bacterium]|nr:hypothetical protein [Bacteroidales bacterium]